MKRQKVVPIKEELRPLLEEFITHPEYQPIFKQFAATIGYHGTKVDRIRALLFIPNKDGEIIFNISGMYELFEEFQLIKQLSDKDPYKTLLIEYPEAIQNIRIVARKIINKEEVSEDDLVFIFNTDAYDEVRDKVDSKIDKSLLDEQDNSSK